MTTFQKWILAILIGFGILFFYFWRSDVKYEQDKDRGIKTLDRYFK